ncbi:hypothetical protein Tco_1318148 [Tanacetum coccineum]
MEQKNQQQIVLDEALVPIDDQVKIGVCNMRIDLLKKQKEPTYQLTLDILKQYSCYNAFFKTTDFPQIYMLQFWYTIHKNKSPPTYQFQLNNQQFEVEFNYFMKCFMSLLKFLIKNLLNLLLTMILFPYTVKGSNDEKVEELSSDDERTKTIGSEKAGNVKANEEVVDKEIVDKEIADEEIVDEEKAEDDRDEDADHAMNDQAGTEQAGGAQAKSHVLEPTVLNPSSNTTEIEIQSMVDVPIDQKDPVVQRTPLVDTAISMFYKDFLELEKKFEILSKINHAESIEESIQANVINEVKNQLPKILPKAMSDFVHPIMEGTVCEVLQNNPINLFQPSSTPAVSFTKYELKNMLFDMIQKSRSFQEHKKHLDLYIALIGSIGLDDVIAKGDIDPTKVLKKRHHDDKNKDPSTNSEKGKKKRRRKDLRHETIQEAAMETIEPVEDNVVNVKEQPQNAAAPKQDNSIWFKQDTVVRPKTLDLDWHKESNAGDAPEQNCFNELVNDKKDIVTFDDLIGNKERKYVVSLTNTKDARYDLEGIEEMIPRLWSSIKEAYDKNVALESITRDPNANKQFGYGYLKEIVVRRADHNEYAFTKADFS